MSLAWPWMLLLLPLPWVVWRWLPPVHRDAPLRVPALTVFGADTRGNPAVGVAVRGCSVELRVAACIWALLVLAAARPQTLADLGAQAVSGRELMIALDVSASMATTDLRVDGQPVERLHVARTLAADFVGGRDGDRVGLIVFGSQAYLHTPLTFDLGAVQAALGATAIGLAGRETALGDAIALAARRQREFGGSARVLVLLTDGASSAGELTPLQAAWIAQREGLRIHTVGLGAERMEVVSAEGVREINPTRELDEDSLREIARLTGGIYARATDGPALEAFYRQVEALEPVAARAPGGRTMRDLHAWPLALALLLAAGLALRRSRGVAQPFAIADHAAATMVGSAPVADRASALGAAAVPAPHASSSPAAEVPR